MSSAVPRYFLIGTAQMKKNKSEIFRKDKNCVHCGLCLEACPTYQLSGNENNSPRGRLALLRAIQEGRIKDDSITDYYLSECIGCLACESACPSNVPYGDIFSEKRNTRKFSENFRASVVKKLAGTVKYPRVFQGIFFPLRILRRFGYTQTFLFKGKPSISHSTAEYADEMKLFFKPDGPEVSLFTGCLMESLFREINFATVRVLMANNIQVKVPKDQVCCGAVLEHNGISGLSELEMRNKAVFKAAKTDLIITNSAGCGLSLKKSLNTKVVDVTEFLSSLALKSGTNPGYSKIFFDAPCHLFHGQKVKKLPEKVFEASGFNWETAPDFEMCCGSGGTYNLTHPHNADRIIRRRCEFMNGLEEGKYALATSNHVCMMQWHSAIKSGYVKTDFRVKHLVQLLDESYEKSGYYKKA